MNWKISVAKKSFQISEYFEWGQTYWFIEHLSSYKRMHRRWLNKQEMIDGTRIESQGPKINSIPFVFHRILNTFNPFIKTGIEDVNLIHDNTSSDRDIQTAWLLILPPTLVSANILFRRRTKSLLGPPSPPAHQCRDGVRTDLDTSELRRK